MTKTAPSLARLAADARAGQTGDTPVANVQAMLRQLVHPVQATESVPLSQALDRVLADELACPRNVPPHDNAAMDGYAFDGRVLGVASSVPLLSLPIAGRVLAGQTWQGGAVPEGRAVRIMTGAAMPPGLDTVLPQELAHSDDAGLLRFDPARLRPGANCRRAGEDLRQGATALAAGTPLGPAELGLAASLGIDTLRVRRRLRVACCSSGDELLDPGTPPREGALYDSNRFALAALLRHQHVEVVELGRIADTTDALEAAWHRAHAAGADAIVSSGGVSGGDADHTRAALHALCGEDETAFWQLALRPGRPLALGRMKPGPDDAAKPATLLFGLPGNPVATMISFLLFVRPALRALAGITRADPPPLRARLAHAIPAKRIGRSEYLRAVVSQGADGELAVATTGPQGSGLLHSMVQANGLIVLPAASGPAEAGQLVDVWMLGGLA